MSAVGYRHTNKRNKVNMDIILWAELASSDLHHRMSIHLIQIISTTTPRSHSIMSE